MLTRETVEKRVAQLVEERQSLLDQLHAYDGAIQFARSLLETDMGEPIVLYNESGERLVVNAPSYARELVEGGMWRNQPFNNPVLTAADENVDDDLDTLRAKAKEAGIPHYHLMKPETLREKLADAS
jgi:hypothetical protein